MDDPQLLETVAELGRERRYSPATLQRLSGMDDADGRVCLELIAELKLGENQYLDLWRWAADIAARDGVTLAQVLGHADLRRALARPIGRADRLKAYKEALRRLRYPQLVAQEARLEALVQQLDLPRGVRVVLPERLEGDTVKIEIEADSAAQLMRCGEAVARAAAAPECAAIFALLDEAT